MADGIGAGQLLVEVMLHKVDDFLVIVEDGLVGILGKAQGIVAGEQHIWQQRPFIEQGRYMVVVAQGFKGFVGQKRGNQFFQAAQVVAILAFVAAVKADDILNFGGWGNIGHGSKRIVQICIIRLANQADMPVRLFQLHVQKNANQLVYLRALHDELRRGIDVQVVFIKRTKVSGGVTPNLRNEGLAQLMSGCLTSCSCL